MCEDFVQAERSSMVSTHQSQDLVVPSPEPDPPSPSHSLTTSGSGAANASSDHGAPGSPAIKEGSSPGMNPATVASGPVNAITVLTLLDKLVNMLDTVQENQHKMEGRQAEMEGAVRGIQADMTKLSKSHTHTSNTVSKLLDKSRKVSVTMKEVRDRMERQGGQVKKLEANHAHLLKRNNFKVLIFQEENEIPSSVFVKEPVPFPHELEEGEESKSVVVDANRSQEEGLHTIDLSSDEDVGLEAENEEEGLEELHELSGEPLERSRADKFKRSSLKKVDSLKRAFSKQNIEKKMTKISTKIVSQEKRDKIKKSLTPNNQKSLFKVSPLTFSIRKRRGSEGPHEAEAEASSQTEGSPSAVASIELSPVGSPNQDLTFTEVHTQLAPELEDVGNALEREEPGAAESNGVPESEEIPESDIPRRSCW
ncbi:caveolae-associated protein 2b [Hypomesus transpacificus]|uniref:caveolae-associated protein 2b n=1 Tax=Hypomesus transpacificus TaxID=137520 RepID=UPI001F08451A|nr:caveolae-associated protein 2b [Hypomesus transpacificus]